MPVIIPTLAVANQTFTTNLNNQSCQINIYQKAYGLFADLLVNNSPIIQGTICHHFVLLVRSLYLGFSGDLCFFDSQGTTDPYYTGLGTRYVLLYYLPTELAPGPPF